MTSKSLSTLASTGDGGPEDAPEELASGSPRLVPPDPEEGTTLTLLEESEEVIPTSSRGKAMDRLEMARRIKCVIALNAWPPRPKSPKLAPKSTQLCSTSSLLETTAGELAHTGHNQSCPLSRHGGTDRAYWAGT
ncbi:hypothetical protein GW17_00062211 [Ensete ventricosum]|nr:hypothetical protein GW17_00062211 [Ensete ventricosum]